MGKVSFVSWARESVTSYWEEYGSYFQKIDPYYFNLDSLISHLDCEYYEPIPLWCSTIYSKLELFKSGDPYKRYVEMMEEQGFLSSDDKSKNIAEVGCGFVAPSPISIMIASKGFELPDNYDPNIVVCTDESKCYKRNFDDDDVEKYDILYGIAPCEATKMLVEDAYKNKKDLFLAMCGCTHFPIEMFYFNPYGITFDMWFDYIVKTAEEFNEKYAHGLRKMEIIDMRDEAKKNIAFLPYPVLVIR